MLIYFTILQQTSFLALTNEITLKDNEYELFAIPMNCDVVICAHTYNCNRDECTTSNTNQSINQSLSLSLSFAFVTVLEF